MLDAAPSPPYRTDIGGAAGLVARLRALLATEGLLIAIGGVFLLFWALAAPYWIQADTWLTLVGGREVVEHGIPRRDELAVLTGGREWIDIQWLAQLAFYGLEVVGGLKLVVLAGILMLLAPLALALVEARRRGASPRAIAPFALLSGLAFTSFVRAQVFSQLLFVILLVLLAAESRRRSRRVFLAFPLLALWANLHGAAVVGAGLVALLGASELAPLVRARAQASKAWVRAGTLVAGPWLCLLATPYGLSTLEAYRSTIGNPVLRQTSTEWMPPTVPSATGFGFFAVAAIAVALVARYRRALTGFELGALALTLAGGLLAVRSIPWFAYAGLILLPPLLERAWTARSGAPAPSRLHAGLALVTTILALGSVGLASLHTESRMTRNWPAQAAAEVERVVRADPSAKVLASHEFGDWLLFESRPLRGRLAFDGRWELLTYEQARSALNYLWQVGPAWERLGLPYRLVVLNPETEAELVSFYERQPGTRVLFRDARVVVVDRARLTSARAAG